MFGAAEMATLLLQVKYGRGRHSDELEVGQLNTIKTVGWNKTVSHIIADIGIVQIRKYVAVLHRELVSSLDPMRHVSPNNETTGLSK